MDAILGVVQVDGTPVDPRRFAAMAAALPWPRSPRVQQAAVECGVLGHASPAGAAAAGPDDGRHAPAPVRDGSLVTAQGRLDNRDDVAAQLGIAPVEAAGLPDTALLQRAYERWGEACAPRLFGDWSLAAWTPAHRRLFLARDHHGNTALHVHRDADRGIVAFASDARTLHAAGASHRIDEDLLAEHLVGWHSDHGPRTLRADVLRVPPGHTCAATDHGIWFTRYWFPEDVPELVLGSRAAYAQAVLPVYAEAVRARCRADGTSGPIGVTLSGGLDSGTVAALAMRELRRRSAALHAFTEAPLLDPSAYVEPGQLGDESALAASTAAFVGIADHHVVRGSSRSPLATLRRGLAAAGQPVLHAGNLLWVQDLLDAVAADGVDVLLTGQHGNATLSWVGRPPLPLQQRLRSTGPRATAAYLQPLWLQRARDRRRHGEGAWPNSVIDPDFARRADLADRMAEAIGRDPSRPRARATGRQRRAAIAGVGTSGTGALWRVLGAMAGVDVRDPTGDPRVIEAAFAVPEWVFRDADGGSRMLMRELAVGLLPEDVRTNTRLGRQGADAALRLQATPDEVEDAIAVVADGPAAQYVSPDLLRAAWSRVLGPPAPEVSKLASGALLSGLMAGLWVDEMSGGRSGDRPRG